MLWWFPVLNSVLFVECVGLFWGSTIVVLQQEPFELHCVVFPMLFPPTWNRFFLPFVGCCCDSVLPIVLATVRFVLFFVSLGLLVRTNVFPKHATRVKKPRRVLICRANSQTERGNIRVKAGWLIIHPGQILLKGRGRRGRLGVPSFFG